MKIIQMTGNFDLEFYSSNELFLCRELTKRGHYVTVYTSTKLPGWRTNRQSYKQKKFEKLDNFTIKRFNPIIEIGIVPLIPEILPCLFKEKFELMHSHDLYTSFALYSSYISKVLKKPLIITQHNDNYPSSIYKHFLYNTYNKTIGKYIAKQANKIIALTKDIKKHLLSLAIPEEKIVIIPNAVDVEKFNPKNENLLKKNNIHDPVILFVGRLVIEKGVDYLLKAYIEVVKQIPQTKLVIVGTGPEKERLEGFIKQKNISNVIFLGSLRNDILPKIYTGATVVVAPSLREPFGNVVLEAMSSGKVVVGSYVGGMKDTIDQGITGYHTSPCNSKELARYLIKVLDNPKLRSRMEKNARMRAVEEFNSKRIIKRIEDIYTETIK